MAFPNSRAPIKPGGVYDRRFGTSRRDPATGTLMPGEYNERDQPIGTGATAPVARNLSAFQSGLTAPNLTRFQAANAPAATSAAPATAARPAQFTQRDGGDTEMTAPMDSTAPARSAFPRPPMNVLTGTARPDADQMQLIRESNAAHLAARTTAPIPLPPGDPAARAFFGKPDSGSGFPRPSTGALLAAAGTGQNVANPYGTAFSTTIPTPAAVPNPLQGPPAMQGPGAPSPAMPPTAPAPSGPIIPTNPLNLAGSPAAAVPVVIESSFPRPSVLPSLPISPVVPTDASRDRLASQLFAPPAPRPSYNVSVNPVSRATPPAPRSFPMPSGSPTSAADSIGAGVPRPMQPATPPPAVDPGLRRLMNDNATGGPQASAFPNPRKRAMPLDEPAEQYG